MLFFPRTEITWAVQVKQYGEPVDSLGIVNQKAWAAYEPTVADGTYWGGQVCGSKGGPGKNSMGKNGGFMWLSCWLLLMLMLVNVDVDVDVFNVGWLCFALAHLRPEQHPLQSEVRQASAPIHKWL